jgi:hypothetical protein
MERIAKIESLPEIIAEMSKPVDHSMSHNRGRNGLFPVPCWPYVPEAHERETDALERWPAVDVSDDPTTYSASTKSSLDEAIREAFQGKQAKPRKNN